MLTTGVHKVKSPGHYEVRRIPFGTDYVWVAGQEEVDERLLEEVLHPWHASYARWVEEERAHPELQEWRELEEL